MAVAVVALLNILALSNVGALSMDINADLYHFQRSYVWIRVCKFLWTFVIIICAVRATLIIVELQRGFVTKPYTNLLRSRTQHAIMTERTR